LRDTASVCHGDVFDVAASGDWPTVFAASFIWGTGRIGYGPRRYRRIVQGAVDRLNEMLTPQYRPRTAT
jgi:Putative 8-oxoguanine DNA glycosylase OGG-like protein